MSVSRLVIHPFLVPIAAILGLFSANLASTTPTQLVLPIAISTLVTALALGVGHVLRFDPHKVGAFLSLNYVHAFMVSALPMAAELIVGFGLTASSVALLFVRRSLERLTSPLNFITAAMLSVPVATLGYDAVVYETATLSASLRSHLAMGPENTKSNGLPNVFLIILDGYASDDILAELYDAENDEFIEFLEKRGFFVARKARSNYAQTSLSLASMLNLDYLPALLQSIDPTSSDRRTLQTLIRQNRLFHVLRRHGYEITTIPSGYGITEVDTVDTTYRVGWKLSMFHQEILSSLSPLKFLRITGLPGADLQYSLHRDRIRGIFKELPKIASEAHQPSLTFVHVLSPHPPFVFDRTGGDLNPVPAFSHSDGSHWLEYHGAGPEVYRRRYKDQLLHLNELLELAIDGILARSASPPVIILQADHGPGSMLDWESADKTNTHERLSAFTAHYWPWQSYAGLYDAVTPVNSLRAMLREILGEPFPELEDRSYFSTWWSPFDFIVVSESSEPPPLGAR
jgi:hypothetical protein